jgi:hypothetical protein
MPLQARAARHVQPRRLADTAGCAAREQAERGRPGSGPHQVRDQRGFGPLAPVAVGILAP